MPYLSLYPQCLANKKCPINVHEIYDWRAQSLSGWQLTASHTTLAPGSLGLLPLRTGAVCTVGGCWGLSTLDLNLTMCVPVPGVDPWRAAVSGRQNKSGCKRIWQGSQLLVPRSTPVAAC